METKKKFEVVQIIPSFTYVTYHVEAFNEAEAEKLVDDFDSSVEKIGEHSEDNEWERIEYDVNQID